MLSLTFFTLQIVNLMLLDNTSRAQVSWYSYTSTSLLPLNSLKPFLKSYEEQVETSEDENYREAVKLALNDATVAGQPEIVQ